MAGNLVKWWKHKILGGYKQFSVQECTTDSEELMYHQVRASSSCSAPPDLLLVSDRENNIPLRSPVVNIIGASTTAPATTTTSPSSSAINACHITSASNNNQRHNQKLHQQHQLQQQQHQHHVTTQQQLSLAYNGTKDIGNSGNVKQQHQKQTGIGSSSSHSKHGQQQQLLQQHDCQQQSSHDMEGQLETQANNHSSTRHAHHTQHQQQHNHHHQQQQQQRSEEHIRLEEFTCDVSVEGGKSSQPLQFSFTFYDLDGHHGKITKDDIVGIVYTIYESIGKSVVVPHSGSKTINVRLTVSPEGKTKAAKTKKNSSALVLDSTQKSAPLATAAQAARRLHRYRPRKLIKSDEEDDDSNSDKERDNTAITNNSNLSHALGHKSASKNHKLNKLKTENHCCVPSTITANNTDLPNSPLDTIYDNLKANPGIITPEACRECLAAVDESRNAAISPTVQYPANKTSTTNEAYMKHVASTRIKMLRKSRKQKHQDCLETRQRSLSVGNETCWKNRHLQKQQTAQQQLLWHAEQQLNQSANGVGGGGSVIMDGVQLRNPLKAGEAKSSSSAAQKRNSAECWKTALNRNDLISIIRESMEKNRLCFQLNGKPQANVSPIRHSQPPPQQQTQHHQQHLLHNQHNNSSSSTNKHHQQQQQQHQTSTTPTISSQRQRSNTVSKIPTLIANHSHSAHQSSHYHASAHHHRSSSCANAISNNNHHQQQQQHDTSLHEIPNNINSSSSNNIYHHQHLQPHIPIYHQQMAINPAVIAAHNALLNGSGGGGSGGSNSASAAGHHGKMNLCGYDSFLHATICGGGLSHSPPAHSSLAAQVTSPSALSPVVSNNGHQQIATVQPIMSSNSQANGKHLSLAVTPNQIKTSKILRSGSYAQSQHQHANTTQNSPQYHGYQRLPSSSKHNLAALHLVSPTMEKPPLDQLDKWRREQVKNYDQLLYAKLSEKLQQTNLVSSSSNNRDSNQRRKHRIMRQRRTNNLIQEANNVSLIGANKLCVREDSDYATMLPIEGDPAECENLLGHSSEEENHSQAGTPEQCEKKLREDLKANSRHVAEGTLVDLDDVDVDEDEGEEEHLRPKVKLTNLPLNADTLLRVEEDEVHDIHLEDGLDIEEDLEVDLEDDLDDVVVGLATQSGRNSAASNDSANAGGASLANANSAANTSTTSSSLIHRYVHEHIHHHYHHFEEKEE